MKLPDNYQLIPATKEHNEIAQSIIFTVLKEYGFDPDLQGADEDLKDIVTFYDKGFFGLIANDLGEHVGAFGFHFLKPKVAKLRKMYLLPEARGLGLGKWMLSTLIEKAKSMGYQRLELETATRLGKAVELYKEFGFKQMHIENATPACNLVFYLEFS